MPFPPPLRLIWRRMNLVVIARGGAAAEYEPEGVRCRADNLKLAKLIGGCCCAAVVAQLRIAVFLAAAFNKHIAGDEEITAVGQPVASQRASVEIIAVRSRRQLNVTGRITAVTRLRIAVIAGLGPLHNPVAASGRLDLT